MPVPSLHYPATRRPARRRIDWLGIVHAVAVTVAAWAVLLALLDAGVMS